MMVALFRIMLVIGGVILVIIIGQPLLEKIKFKTTGLEVQGRIIGFRGSKSSKTIFEENTAKKIKGKRSRRPVFRYPTAPASLDSIDGFSQSVILLPWMNYELNDKVLVVLDKNDPEKAHIFGFGLILTDIVLVLFSFFVIGLGLYKKK